MYGRLRGDLLVEPKNVNLLHHFVMCCVEPTLNKVFQVISGVFVCLLAVNWIRTFLVSTLCWPLK